MKQFALITEPYKFLILQ